MMDFEEKTTNLARSAKKAAQRMTAVIKDYIYPQVLSESLTVDAFNKISERIPLANFLNYRYMDDEGVFLADNPEGMDSYLVGFELSPLIQAGEKAESALTELFEKMPDGVVIHNIVLANKDIKLFLDNWATSRLDGDSEIFTNITLKRAKYFLDWANGGQTRTGQDLDFKPRSIRYFWFVKIPSNQLDTDAYNQQLFRHQVQRVTHEVDASLKSVGLGVSQLSGTQTVKAIKHIVTMHLDAADVNESAFTSRLSVSRQILDQEYRVHVDNDGFIYPEKKESEKRFACLTAVGIPESPHYLAKMSSCIGDAQLPNSIIPGDFYAYTIFEMLNNKSARSNASTTMGWLAKQTSSSSEWYRSMMSHAYKRKENVTKLYNALATSRPVKVFTGIVISSDSEAKLIDAISKAKQQWRTIGFDLYQESAIALPMYLASLPGQYRSELDGVNKGLQRGITVIAKDAATLAHVQGDWKGSHPSDGGMLLLSRRGDLVSLNVLASITGYNGILAAVTGAGKTFFIAEMGADFRARGGSVRVIDAGRGQYNLAELANGKNITFDNESKICINPCSWLYTEADLHENLKSIIEIISLMAFPEVALSDAEKARRRLPINALGQIIPDTWRELHAKGEHLDFNIQHIVEKCRLSQDKEVSDLAIHLHRWAYEDYAKWVVGRSNLDLENPFTVLELNDIADDKNLQGVVLNLIISLMLQDMFLNTEKELKKFNKKLPKLFIIDEAWKLLARPDTAEFINEAYRRARKYNASVWVIDQTFVTKKGDLEAEASTGASIAKSQSNWILALLQDIGPLKNAASSGLVELSDYGLNLIESLQKTEDYSEVYVCNKSTKGQGLYRLCVEDMSYWTYTSKSEERAKLDAMLQNGMGLKEAISRLSGGDNS